MYEQGILWLVYRSELLLIMAIAIIYNYMLSRDWREREGGRGRVMLIILPFVVAITSVLLTLIIFTKSTEIYNHMMSITVSYMIVWC